MTFSIDIGMGLTSLSVLNRGGLTALLTWAGSAGHASLIQRAGLFDADADENGLGPQGTESGSPLTYDGSEGADPGGQAPVNWDLVSAFSAATLADITREGYFHYELDTEIASVIPAAAAYICHGDSAADLEQSLINITTGFHQHEFNAGSGTTMQTFPHKMSGNHTGSNVTVDIIWSETGNFFELYTNGLLYSSTTWTQIADATLWESFFIVGKGATTSDYESAGNGGFMRRAFLLSESPVISKKTDTIILMGDSFLGHGGFGADINGTVTIGQLPWGPVSTVLSGTPADTKIQNGFNAGNLGSTTYMESRFFADTGFVPQFFRILAQAGNHIGAHSCNYIATASSYDSSGEDIEAQMAAAITDSHAPTKGVVWTGSIDVSILVAATRTPADIRTSVQGNIAAVITAGLDRVGGERAP